MIDIAPGTRIEIKDHLYTVDDKMQITVPGKDNTDEVVITAPNLYTMIAVGLARIVRTKTYEFKSKFYGDWANSTTPFTVKAGGYLFRGDFNGKHIFVKIEVEESIEDKDED